ncbi:hypothetical protein [Nesterenkonia sp.]|uniref:hypothetical protein n=1 Tax=Nesterenkonia sp. TaxID=704201 RepID=UPI00261685D0|nr:hypothetical protein [Nesterenkonia sp.]
MRWKKLSSWGAPRLGSDQWAPLRAEILAEDLEAVEQVLEELTGFMDFFRADIDGAPLTGVTDGQLAVAHQIATDTWGRRMLEVTFYASGPEGESSPDAFERLARAAGTLVDELQAEGVAVEAIRWSERPYVTRPF